jgi:hypothetical protein
MRRVSNPIQMAPCRTPQEKHNRKSGWLGLAALGYGGRSFCKVRFHSDWAWLAPLDVDGVSREWSFVATVIPGHSPIRAYPVRSGRIGKRCATRRVHRSEPRVAQTPAGRTIVL